MVRRSRVDVEPRGLDRHLARLVAQAAELAKKIICDRGLVAADRFDVHQLAGERNSVHGGENSRSRVVPRGTPVGTYLFFRLELIPTAAASREKTRASGMTATIQSDRYPAALRGLCLHARLCNLEW